MQTALSWEQRLPEACGKQNESLGFSQLILFHWKYPTVTLFQHCRRQLILSPVFYSSKKGGSHKVTSTIYESSTVRNFRTPFNILYCPQVLLVCSAVKKKSFQLVEGLGTFIHYWAQALKRDNKESIFTLFAGCVTWPNLWAPAIFENDE